MKWMAYYDQYCDNIKDFDLTVSVLKYKNDISQC